jgi:hypothetical protein
LLGCLFNFCGHVQRYWSYHSSWKVRNIFFLSSRMLMGMLVEQMAM